MTQDEIIDMAIQAGINNSTNGLFFQCDKADLNRFAQLVAEKERERYMQLFLDPENQPTQFGTATQEYREQEIKDEREACAKVCEEVGEHPSLTPRHCAESIRERGEA